LSAVKILREEGMINEGVAAELEGKVHDEDGKIDHFLAGADSSFCGSGYADSYADGSSKAMKCSGGYLIRSIFSH